VKKQEVLDLVQGMPDEIDTEDLMYRLYLKAKIDAGEADIAAGDVVSHEEVVRLTEEWLK
jgi:predicted transcriptional regulator